MRKIHWYKYWYEYSPESENQTIKMSAKTNAILLKYMHYHDYMRAIQLALNYTNC